MYIPTSAERGKRFVAVRLLYPVKLHVIHLRVSDVSLCKLALIRSISKTS